MDDSQLQQLLDFLQLSWKGYRKVRKGVKKRIHRHMQHLGCTYMNAYLGCLVAAPVHLQACRQLMGVTISRFMRDRSLWEALQKPLLPDLIRQENARLRVWSAGCACGEEPYSLVITWELLRGRMNLPPDPLILASDYLWQCLELARQADYPRSSTRELSDAERHRFFDPQRGGRRMVLKRDLQSRVHFVQHQLLSEPPARSFHMVFLRNNLLTYYRPEVKEPALSAIVGHLLPGGLLIRGAREELPGQEHGLAPTVHPHVFRKRNVS